MFLLLLFFFFFCSCFCCAFLFLFRFASAAPARIVCTDPVLLSLSTSLSLSFCLTLTLTPCLVLSASACLCLPLSPSFVCQFSAFGYNFLGPFVFAVICLGLFLFLSLLHTSFIFWPFFDFPSQFFFAATAEQTYSLFSLLVPSSLFKVALHSIHNPHSIHTKSKPMSFRAAPTQKSQ